MREMGGGKAVGDSTLLGFQQGDICFSGLLFVTVVGQASTAHALKNSVR
jgi:hypothetical protein